MTLLTSLLNHQFPVNPKIHWQLCDVRDVAACHVNALASSQCNRKRYVIVNNNMWTSDIAQVFVCLFCFHFFILLCFAWSLDLLYFGSYWMLWIIGRFNPLVRNFILPQYGKLRLVDSSPAVKDLSIVYRNSHDILLDAANSLIQHKLVKIPPNFCESNKAKL
ncbi:hypothetical protein RFI_05750 [Reticulomyxa filosa]|uniref:3-beta hydroxysteroid dehydrogenase/isomerase domain-containing protein n=1 Tax=Reticulomyxa filosa TaxID=46433 RepID=X6NYK0_RETFI|nr:hypothetical protein RFI_05750 [Reticulomyxa filosa]|eukprot:ETO31370.1 hypothetical protein RFI_05750 [Reticulomyxa filosa]